MSNITTKKGIEMSLKDLLEAKRSALKPTRTVVTTCNGKKFLEHHSDDPAEQIQIDEQSYGFVVDTKPDLMAACILEDFLYLGSQDAVNDDNIAKYHLTHILSLGVEISTTPHSVTSKFIHCLDLPDTDLLENVVPQAINFIKEAHKQSGRVLVHCNAGVSRSASIVIAFLMETQHISYETAYEIVKSKRECVQPNCGFVKQLKRFEEKS